MHDDRAIGIFDSGFGGLTVARAIMDLLPDEDVVYFGDTGRYPYGPRPLEEVRGFAHQIAASLVADHDEKLAIEDTTLWDYPDHLMIAAATDAAARAPEADAIVQTGAGFRMLQVVAAVEGMTGMPVVASDFALYWAMLRQLGLTAAPGHGSLLDSLSPPA